MCLAYRLSPMTNLFTRHWRQGMNKIIIEGQPEVLVEMLDLIMEVMEQAELSSLIQVTTEE